ncbi:MAG: gliding motility-associated C-terminal domain-containing protein [Bacteroidales bacterium]|nr:gliding motility-associated C-terminal domain-containing protein [Candidatus Colimorpha onthohippi]
MKRIRFFKIVLFSPLVRRHVRWQVGLAGQAGRHIVKHVCICLAGWQARFAESIGLLGLMSALLVTSMAGAQQDTQSLRLWVSVDGLCADLRWDSVVGPYNPHYALWVSYPYEQEVRGAVTDTTVLRYCATHRVCGDTVSFRIEAYDSCVRGVSISVGEVMRDNGPTQPPTPISAADDGVSGRIRLTWSPSPDTDIVGYCLCTGVPCQSYDTIWGVSETSYVCADHWATDQHTYRVLAFDSCGKASPWTQYFGNLPLKIYTQQCSRDVVLQWPDFKELVSNVSYYALYLSADGGAWERIDSIEARRDVTYTCTVADDIMDVAFKVGACTSDNSYCVYSNVVRYEVGVVDTAQYLRIDKAEYDIVSGEIALEMSVDDAFETDYYVLWRLDDYGEWQEIATFPYGNQRFTYSDRITLSSRSEGYSYRLSTLDRCKRVSSYSVPVVTYIPDASTKGVVFPNVITPSRIDNNRFCPIFRFLNWEFYRLSIYNRFGALVFETTDNTQCWDGKHDGVQVPQGVYVYMLRCRWMDGTLGEERGTVTVVY